MNFLLAVLAFSMVYIVGVPGVVPDGPVQIAEISPDSPAAAAGIQPGDVLASFNGQPVNVQTFRDATATHLDQPVQVEVRRGSQAPSDARLIGLVGMAQATSETVSYVADTGFWYPLFVLTGLFSAGLSIANLLPIPALDGGRLFFVLLEWIRGRRVPPEREAAFHFVGIVVLLTLMVIISFNDLVSPLPAINWGGR